MSDLLPLDKYLVLGNRVYQIYRTNKQQEIFVHSGRVVWYDPAIDGVALTQKELEKVYPEWLI